MISIDEKIILSAIRNLPKNEAELSALKRDFIGKNKGATALPSKTALLTAYHKLLGAKSIQKNPKLEKILTRRSVRTLSGVTIITSLVKPYPCPGACVYCPLDVRMPKSYLSEEPAAARALALKFDPYKQMQKRLEALENNGHPTDKIELIVKGGTWNAYPLQYQFWFILRSFQAANTPSFILPLKGGGRGWGSASLEKLKKELIRQQKLNEKAKHRVIGITLETRPDSINEKTLWQMREQGCTRIELGVQHTDEEILKLVKRGHTVEQVKSAMELAKNFGFKVDFHLMPQLPGATPEGDLAMLMEIFENPAFRPDMIKIYPCSVVKGSELYDWFQERKFHSYPVEELIAILKKFKSIIPVYTRISRLIRDIPGQLIETGNKVTNLRQVIQSEMKAEGTYCRCLRCREAGHINLKNIKDLSPVLFIEQYEASGGTEYFLSFEDKKRQVVFAFCRLRLIHSPIILSETPARTTEWSGRKNPLNDKGKGSFASAQDDKKNTTPFSAYIRELHTYGQLISIGKHDKASSQHQGLGKKLLKEAEKISKKNGLNELAVISGIGVRDYYRGLGYRLQHTYMVKKLI